MLIVKQKSPSIFSNKLVTQEHECQLGAVPVLPWLIEAVKGQEPRISLSMTKIKYFLNRMLAYFPYLSTHISSDWTYWHKHVGLSGIFARNNNNNSNNNDNKKKTQTEIPFFRRQTKRKWLEGTWRKGQRSAILSRRTSREKLNPNFVFL